MRLLYPLFICRRAVDLLTTLYFETFPDPHSAGGVETRFGAYALRAA
jgi:hypothetical protein